MTYHVFSGPRGAPVPKGLEKDRMLYKEFDTFDAALAWARHVNQNESRVALLIEGDDGTRLAKEDIVTALHHPDYGDLGRRGAQGASRAR